MKKILAALLLCLLPSLAQAASCTSYPFALQNNTTADATQVMSNFNTVRNCVVNNAASLGSNSDITALLGLTTPLAPGFGGTPVFVGGTSTGTANAQTVASATPTGYSLTSGYRVTFIAGATNTTATTLNVNSTGATAVRRIGPAGPEALTGGELVAGNIIEAIYDGTFHILLTTEPANVNTLTTLASATTTDLGTIPSHNVSISGTTTITGFGSTAVTTNPIYRIKFTGALTLTYNAASLIIPGIANIATAANDSAVVEYLGSGNWQVLSYTKASGAGVVAVTPLCGANGLVIANNSGTPNTLIDYTAASATLTSSTGTSVAAAFSGTINTTNTGVVDGIQSARGNNQWYDIYFISNGTLKGGFAVAHGTSLSAPAGYIYSCYMGQMQTNGSGNFYSMRLTGRVGHWVGGIVAGNSEIPCLVQSGTIGTYSVTSPTLFAVQVTGNGFCAPVTAIAGLIIGNPNYKGNGGASILAAPSTAYSGANNGPQGVNGRGFPIWVSTGFGSSAWITLEGNSIYVAGNANGASFWLSDWIDSVNAN